jgi:hypothetical protein
MEIEMSVSGFDIFITCKGLEMSNFVLHCRGINLEKWSLKMWSDGQTNIKYLTYKRSFDTFCDTDKH